MRKRISTRRNSAVPRFPNCLRTALRFVIFVVFAVPFSLAQKESADSLLETVRHLPPIEDDLHNGMEHVARIFRAPMLVVLKGDNATLTINEGSTTLRQVLDSAVHQNAGYIWEANNGVIYFHELTLQKAPLNFLNWKLKRFTIFDNAALVNLSLRAHIQNVRYHASAEGGAITGVMDAELEKHSLPSSTLTDVTPADVVLKTLSMDRQFYSIIQFPGPGPLKDSDLDAAFISWRWVPFQTSPKPGN